MNAALAGRMRPLALALGLAATGCVSPRPGPEPVSLAAPVARSTTRFHKEYVLAPGDQIDVVVRRTPEASRVVAVRPDGMITLPLAHDVAAGGLTTRELEAKLKDVLSARLVDPEVTVIATQVRVPVVYVMGEVNNPTAVPFRDAPTALQAIALAGGFRKTAAESDTLVVRLEDDGYVRALAAGKAPSGQPGPAMALRATPTRPDDVIFVPESGRSQTARFLDDFLYRPLTGVSAIFSTYANFRYIQDLNNTSK